MPALLEPVAITTGLSALKLFLSYSHKDDDLRAELSNHLKPLEREGLILAWHDRKILGGEQWADAIDDNLAVADVILLLISADFCASDYCWNNEMTSALKRHEAGVAIVVPIILRECDWNASSFSKLQALPKDGKAVATWASRDAGFTDVARGLRRVVNELRRKKGGPTAEQDVGTAKVAIGAMGEMMAEPEMRRAVDVVGCTKQMRETRDQLDTIEKYKTIHDQLHKLQMQCCSPMVREYRGFPKEPINSENLQMAGEDLAAIIQELEDTPNEPRFGANERERLTSTLTILGDAATDLKATTAGAQPDPERLNKACRGLKRVLARQPEFFSTNLTRLARTLKLDDLAVSMTRARNELNGYRPSAALLEQYDGGTAALRRLDTELTGLIECHDRWQAFETILRTIEEQSQNDLPEELSASWAELGERSAKLGSGSTDSWGDAIKSQTQDLKKALDSKQSDAIVAAFINFRGWAAQRFYRVDRALLRLTKKLCDVGKPLDNILENHP